MQLIINLVVVTLFLFLYITLFFSLPLSITKENLFVSSKTIILKIYEIIKEFIVKTSYLKKNKIRILFEDSYQGTIRNFLHIKQLYIKKVLFCIFYEQ